jgi:polar amino acid transport system substrate-binding protein
MQKNKLSARLLPALAITALLSIVARANASDLQAVTAEDNFPFNFIVDGKIHGIGLEVATELARRKGKTLTAVVLPWERAVLTARIEPERLLFSIVRSAAREDSFHWIGPFGSREIWLFKMRERQDIIVNTMADARNFRVGDTQDNATNSLFVRNGITPVISRSDIDSCRKLKEGVVDLVPLNVLEGDFYAKRCGMPPGQLLKTARIFQGDGYYMVLGKNTDPNVVSEYRAIFSSMQKDGTLKKIIDRWEVQAKLE